MAYTKIEGYRLPYHLDGTRVGYNTTGFTNPSTTVFSSAQLTQYNAEGATTYMNSGTFYVVIIFPELVNITHLAIRSSSSSATIDSLKGSSDTIDGVDGTWATPTSAGTYGKLNPPSDWWMTPAAVTFANPVRAIQVKCYVSSGFFHNIHIYGTKASGQTPNDIVFLQSDGVTPYTTIQWDGALYENGEKQTTVYLKNTSAANTANNLALTTGGTNKADFSFSVDNGATFVSSYTLTSLAPGATQKLILKNKIGAAPQVLGPRNGSIDCVIGSWT